jgi:hypothetical protein
MEQGLIELNTRFLRASGRRRSGALVWIEEIEKGDEQPSMSL